jgi:hypothetical protein
MEMLRSVEIRPEPKKSKLAKINPIFTELSQLLKKNGCQPKKQNKKISLIQAETTLN